MQSVISSVISSGKESAGIQVSVIIVSWNAKTFLQECLDSLSRGVSSSMEVIVVDNASRDGSPEMVSDTFPWVRLIQTGANLGFAKANNIGIRESRGKYVALVNSDVNVLPGCLDNLVSFLDSHTDVGMVGPRVMYGDRRLQSSCRHFPTVWNNFCEVFKLNKMFKRSPFFSGEHMFYFPYNQVREVDVLVGCFILARRSAIDCFGLLDESFFMYGEDLDWCRRCSQSGWKVMFSPGSQAIHYAGGSSSNDPGRFAVEQQRARLQLWKKHHGVPAQVAVRILVAFQCFIRIMAALLKFLSRKCSTERSRERMRTQLACLRALAS